jgi:6-phosphogluconate dehydrogenase
LDGWAANIVRRLARAGHSCVVYDADLAPGAALAREGATAAVSVEDLVRTLAAPRTVWVMLPAGRITEQTIVELGGLMQAGDVVIDGGNTNFKDDVRRGSRAGAQWHQVPGCRHLGGRLGPGARLLPDDRRRRRDRDAARPDLLGAGSGARQHRAHQGSGPAASMARRSICAPSRATSTPGPVGAGHFVKMIHNGIEYG